jgi:hypothetical protein
MKAIYAYLCRHDRFTLGLITALTAVAWAAYFTPIDYADIGRTSFLVCFGTVTALWGVLVTGTCLDWSSSK